MMTLLQTIQLQSSNHPSCALPHKRLPKCTKGLWRVLCSSPLMACLVLSAMSACNQDANPPTILQLDRPQDVVFFCVGSQRLDNGDVVTDRALPRSLCERWAEDGVAPEGQETVSSIPDYFGVVLQASRGSAAVIKVADAQSSPTTAVLDSDPLTPGKNDIPLGTNPTQMTGDESGCFAVTANQGSCDLSTLDFTTAIDANVPAITEKIQITGGDGAPLSAHPAAIEVFGNASPLDARCPERAKGIAYIAYPSCDLVAVTNLESGDTIGGIKFDADGSARIASSAEWVCANECQDGDASVSTGLVEPQALQIIENEDGSQHLLIGSRQSSGIVDISLDAFGLPQNVNVIEFEGEIGFTQMELSSPIFVGGDLGTAALSFGPYRFLYSVATDGTVRVADYDNATECDTQVDPRYLRTENDVEFLSCMPVGDPRTPPRRATAKTPGIELPSQATSVAVVTLEDDTADLNNINPLALIGTFAFITTFDGKIWVANVDDDNYPDFEDPLNPSLVSMSLAIAHQLRDSVADREERDSNSTCEETVEVFNQYGSRLSGDIEINTTSQVSSSRVFQMPRIRQTTCVEDLGATDETTLINEMSYLAPDAFLEEAFPDTFATQNETWRMTWEGTLSLDSVLTDVDGPRVREGIVDSENGKLFIDDPARSICSTGVEVGDLVDILGCTSISDCGVGEVCYFHPESTIATRDGLCIPEDQVDALADECKDFIVSRRTFRVELPSVGTLQMTPRAKVLAATPLDGCVSDQQCMDMAEVRRKLDLADHPSRVPESDEEPTEYTCQLDPTLSDTTQPVCVMTCDPDQENRNEGCENGYVCSDDGICLEGAVPSRLCLQSAQRYQIRAGNAFVVVGSVSGYQHQQIAEPQSGICIADPNGHPLLHGRIPLRPEPCVPGPMSSTSDSNVCSVDLDDAELAVVYKPDEELCILDSEETAIETTSKSAIRFSNPQMNFHLVNSESMGDQRCNRDGLGEFGPHKNFSEGFSVQFDVSGGFLPMTVPGVSIAFPVFIAKAPNDRLWVMDKGDLITTTSFQRGQVVTLDPTQALSNFDVSVVR